MNNINYENLEINSLKPNNNRFSAVLNLTLRGVKEEDSRLAVYSDIISNLFLKSASAKIKLSQIVKQRKKVSATELHLSFFDTVDNFTLNSNNLLSRIQDFLLSSGASLVDIECDSRKLSLLVRADNEHNDVLKITFLSIGSSAVRSSNLMRTYAESLILNVLNINEVSTIES